MIAIIDNDIVLKLAKWDLLDRLIEVFNCSADKIYHLPTCKWVLCNPNKPEKALKRCGDVNTIERIMTFCCDTKPIPQPSKLQWLDVLNKIPEIDTGEVLIFVFGAATCDSLLYIGDKRSIVALAQSIEAKEIASKLEKRMKCLEQVLAEMICAHGVEEIHTKVASCISADKSVKAIFGSLEAIRTGADIWEGLFSYYMDLQRYAGDLLAQFPDTPQAILNTRHKAIVASQTT